MEGIIHWGLLVIQDESSSCLMSKYLDMLEEQLIEVS